MSRACSRAAISKCSTRPRTPRSAASLISRSRAMPACISLRSRSATPSAAHRRLESSGFRVRPIAHMQRPVDTEAGPDTAKFTVTRVERGEMAEGRIQILTHHTEAAVWQPRWLSHPNGATGLIDVVIATADIEEAAGRFSRFLGEGRRECFRQSCSARSRWRSAHDARGVCAAYAGSARLRCLSSGSMPSRCARSRRCAQA